MKVVEKFKIHMLCLVTFFLSENHAVYEIMSKNVVETEAADNMAHARGILDK